VSDPAAETVAIVRQVLVEVANDPGIEETTQLAIDSLQALQVLVELEKQFDLEIDELEIFDGWFDTPRLIAEYLERLRQRRGEGAADLPRSAVS
jgi:acyl carrier protein